MEMNDDREIVYLNEWNIGRKTLNDDKYDDDDDVNEFVYHCLSLMMMMMNRRVWCLLIREEHILIRLMFDEWINRFVQIDQPVLSEESSILDLNRYHIYRREKYYSDEMNVVRHNRDQLSKEWK